MNVEELFSFLVKDYGFVYREQDFQNCFGGKWFVKTYSFFNHNGCFTIHTLPQRGELDFYYSSHFCNTREGLCEKTLNVCSIEPKVWEQKTKLFGVNNPFFWWSDNRVLSTLATALKLHLSKHDAFFGISVR